MYVLQGIITRSACRSGGVTTRSLNLQPLATLADTMVLCGAASVKSAVQLVGHAGRSKMRLSADTAVLPLAAGASRVPVATCRGRLAREARLAARDPRATWRPGAVVPPTRRTRAGVHE